VSKSLWPKSLWPKSLAPSSPAPASLAPGADRELQTTAALEQAERASGTRSSRTWDPKEWEEDHRFVAAMDALAAGAKRDALSKLLQLHEDDPGHLFGRIQLFTIALELKMGGLIAEHAEWALQFHSKNTSAQIAADTYREVRLATPDFEWSEKSLISALLAGDKARDKRVIVDATKLLLRCFPESRALPRAFLSSADVQLEEGRPDLARATLKSLIARYPLDPLVPHAERRLAEIDRPLNSVEDDVRTSRLFTLPPTGTGQLPDPSRVRVSFPPPKKT
jgi:predicted Zn-dependent protease